MCEVCLVYLFIIAVDRRRRYVDEVVWQKCAPNAVSGVSRSGLEALAVCRHVIVAYVVVNDNVVDDDVDVVIIANIIRQQVHLEGSLMKRVMSCNSYSGVRKN